MAKRDEERVEKKSRPLIAVVGPCASGKSALVRRLKALGYNARHVAQDHSYVPDMWRRLTNPDLLIYLDAELSTIARRRHIGWGERYLADERRRLRHARQHCDLYINTSRLAPDEVRASALTFLQKQHPQANQ